MVKRRAAPNPEAMMIAVRFAGERRVDGEGEGEDGDEEVFMVFLFLFLLVLFFYFFIFVCFFEFLRESYLLLLLRFFSVIGILFFSFLSKKLGRSLCCLVGWLVAVFSFFGDFGGFLLVLCYRFTYEWPAS